MEQMPDSLEAHIRSMIEQAIDEREVIWRERLNRHMVRLAEYEGVQYLEQGMRRPDGTVEAGARP